MCGQRRWALQPLLRGTGYVLSGLSVLCALQGDRLPPVVTIVRARGLRNLASDVGEVIRDRQTNAEDSAGRAHGTHVRFACPRDLVPAILRALFVAACVGASLAVSSCRPSDSDSSASMRQRDASPPAPLKEICGDGRDNDVNGQVDECPHVPVQRSCVTSLVPGCGVVVLTVLGRSLAVDSYEVTVARFRRYWDAGHRAPHHPVAFPGGTWRIRQADTHVVNLQLGAEGPCNWSEHPSNREAHPMNCLPAEVAVGFCAWDGGRVPEEEEFQDIAWNMPGVTSGEFPWGDTFTECASFQTGPCRGDDGARTRRVGSFPPHGGALYDLFGNVGEVVFTPPRGWKAGGHAWNTSGRFKLSTAGWFRRPHLVAGWPDYDGLEGRGVRCVREIPRSRHR